jgi:hypothetical protein
LILFQHVREIHKTTKPYMRRISILIAIFHLRFFGGKNS